MSVTTLDQLTNMQNQNQNTPAVNVIPADETAASAVEQPVTGVPKEEPIVEQPVNVVEEKTMQDAADATSDFHAQVPNDPLSNLAALSASLDEELDAAQEMAEKEQQRQELAKVTEETENRNQFNDKIVEVDEIPEDKAEDKKDEDEDLLITSDELKNLKVCKFKKKDEYKKRYERLLQRRKKEHNLNATQTVLINSGYSAKFSGFMAPELVKVQSYISSVDAFSATKFLYEKIFNHLVETGIGEMTFDTFLKNTSLIEMNSIMYALFDSTYPSVNEYPGSCTFDDCKHQFTFKYQNKQLLYIDPENNEEVSQQILGILNSTNPLETLKNSNINFTLRKKLSTGTIIDFRHPSLYNHLTDTLEEMAKNDLLDTDEEMITLMPFIDKILVYDEEIQSYIELEDFEERLMELQYMNDDDLETCVKIVRSIEQEYKIKFGFKNLTCPRCKRKLPDTEIADMSQLLFLVHKMKTKNV